MQNEVILQKAVHSYLANPSLVFSTVSGKRLQILSPGRHNDSAGPDFLDAAIMLDGNVIVGDMEFHRKSSEWYQHSHFGDENYKSVILHIVFEHNSDEKENFETLILEKNLINIELNIQADDKKPSDIHSIEELQDYALFRLLRKAAEARKLLNSNTITDTLYELALSFLDRYNRRQKRPIYSSKSLYSILEKIKTSKAADFLSRLENALIQSVPDSLKELLESDLSGEGKHLRLEIILNCIFPLSVCISGEAERIELFAWYWQAPALSRYGILAKRFRDIPQQYIWQQQGLLEYIREHGNKTKICSELIKDYGFAAVLGFFRQARAPLNIPYYEDTESLSLSI
ncbi:MAG: hypothetical protein QG635_960 [Bacteroidota bacterium]|nr:hypothetical protein [Bacteroidota bacterium]